MLILDINYDTGKPTSTCGYSLADDTYTELLLALQEQGLQTMPSALKANVLGFYQSTTIPPPSKQCNKFWQALQELRPK